MTAFLYRIFAKSGEHPFGDFTEGLYTQRILIAANNQEQADRKIKRIANKHELLSKKVIPKGKATIISVGPGHSNWSDFNTSSRSGINPGNLKQLIDRRKFKTST